MKYIDAVPDKIRAEIERRIEASDFDESANLYGLLSFLDTLESETSYDTLQYNPSPSVDIWDVARVQFASHAKVFDKKRKAVFDWEQFKEVAGIFYGFGQQNNTLSEEPVSDCHDLEDEIDRVIADYSFTKTIDSGGFKTTVLDYAKIARHFYELGLNARKEE